MRISSISLLALLLCSSLCGETKNFSHIGINKVLKTSNFKYTLKVEEIKTIFADTSINIIEGSVVDSETKEFLPGASVIIKRTVRGTSTDAEGNFYLVIPENLLKLKIVLVISTVGYKRKEFPVNIKDIHIKKNFLMTKWNKKKYDSVLLKKRVYYKI